MGKYTNEIQKLWDDAMAQISTGNPQQSNPSEAMQQALTNRNPNNNGSK
jgi:hypothetical protein